MSLLSWNCRGSGGLATVPTIRRYLRSIGADLAFISETKCSQVKAKQRIARLPLNNSEIVPSIGRGGGLWLLWSDNVSVSIIESTFYYIVAEVQLQPHLQPWLLFATYGDCDDRMNFQIWDRIRHYIHHSGMPLCTIGDFNCIMDPNEKTGGVFTFKPKNKKFRAFVQQAGLIDLGHTGPAYT